MQISEQIPDSDATFLRRGEGELAVVFVHGFLDDQHVWDKVIHELKRQGSRLSGWISPAWAIAATPADRSPMSGSPTRWVRSPTESASRS